MSTAGGREIAALGEGGDGKKENWEYEIKPQRDFFSVRNYNKSNCAGNLGFRCINLIIIIEWDILIGIKGGGILDGRLSGSARLKIKVLQKGAKDNKYDLNVVYKR